MNFWLSDPRTKQPSVSLTMLTVTFVTFLVTSILQMLGKGTSPAGLTEMFGITAGLYFGRRFTDASGRVLEAPPSAPSTVTSATHKES